jgi:hypothetical protein
MKSLPAKYDSGLCQIKSGDGAVLVAPGLQGRIFCTVEDELMHRFDEECLSGSAEGEFRNIGGNSLWPAPEGGEFAFNYLAGSDEWLVQPGIADAPYQITSAESGRIVINKEIELANRRGISCRIMCGRKITADVNFFAGIAAGIAGSGLRGVWYSCHDILNPADKVASDDMLLSAWSLEQFSGSDDIVSFAKFAGTDKSVNFDFYGMPENEPIYREDYFLLELTGGNRFQIGIPVKSAPLVLGAVDRRRGIMILRHTERQQGTYFNIADNEQPDGAFSAADMYSVFCGGDLQFFELETIGSMSVSDGIVSSCDLFSETVILRGDIDSITGLLAEHFGIDINKR